MAVARRVTAQSQEEQSQMLNEKVLYLVKANDDLISHCRCERTLVGAPAQMDCPWCGCGWLFVCPSCGKAFTFARAEEVELTWEQLAHNDLDGKWGRDPTAEEIEEWIGFMKILLKGLEQGKQYVYIDGWVFPTDGTDIQFEGWHSRHLFGTLPHLAALEDPSVIDEILANKEYWLTCRIDEE